MSYIFFVLGWGKPKNISLNILQRYLHSHSMLTLWVVMTFSVALLPNAWQVAITVCCPFGMNDMLDFVIQLDCWPDTTVDVLFFSGSPATVHLMVDGGLLRSVSQLRTTVSSCFASSGPLMWTWLGPSETDHIKLYNLWKKPMFWGLFKFKMYENNPLYQPKNKNHKTIFS